MKKKIISAVLVLTIVIAMLPTTAFADNAGFNKAMQILDLVMRFFESEAWVTLTNALTQLFESLSNLFANIGNKDIGGNDVPAVVLG